MMPLKHRGKMAGLYIGGFTSGSILAILAYESYRDLHVHSFLTTSVHRSLALTLDKETDHE